MTENEAWALYKKRRKKRLDGKEEDGKWVTTDSGHKVHISEDGSPDKGNPRVIQTMTNKVALKESEKYRSFADDINSMDKKAIVARAKKDPEFKELVDAITLYTQGAYGMQKHRCEDMVKSGISDKDDLTVAELAKSIDDDGFVKQLWNGQKLFESQSSVNGGIASMIGAINNSKEDSPELYRLADDRGWGSLTHEKLYLPPKVGDKLRMDAPTSFTKDKEVLKEVAKAKYGDRIYYTLEQGARSLDIERISRFKQKESLTCGEFEVTDVRTDVHKLIPKSKVDGDKRNRERFKGRPTAVDEDGKEWYGPLKVYITIRQAGKTEFGKRADSTVGYIDTRNHFDDEWKTIKGTHVLVDDDGSIKKGPKVLKKLNGKDKNQSTKSADNWRKTQHEKIKNAETEIKSYEDRIEKSKKLEQEKNELELSIYGKKREIEKLENSIKATEDVLSNPEEYGMDEETCKIYKSRVEDRKKEVEKKKNDKEYKEATSKIESIKREIEESRGEDAKNRYEEAKKERDEAVDDIINNSACSEQVKKYRAIEEDLIQDKKALGVLNEEIGKKEKQVNSFKRNAEMLYSVGEKDTAEMMKAGYEIHKAELEKLQEKRNPIQKRVEQNEKNIKEFANTESEEWKEVYDLSVERDTVKNGPYEELKDVFALSHYYSMDYNNPKKLLKEQSEEAIVEKLGGGDKTKGSCVSLAFAYIANKGGYNVVDYRGGGSREFFAGHGREVVEKLGGYVEEKENALDSAHAVLKNVEDGKEYYFSAGNHAAVVRSKSGVLEYLEMQSETENGWKTLNDETLAWRFRAGGVDDKKAGLIESERLYGNKEFISLTGYLNTNVEEQQKGDGGSEK